MSERPRVLIVDNQTVHLEALEALVQNTIPGCVINFSRTREVDEKDIGESALVILSGGTGRSIEKNPETFKKLIGQIEAANKPCIGICLGAEAIAVYYGALLEQMPVRRVGNIPVEITRNSNGVLDSFTGLRNMVYEFHKWKIINLPESLEELAVSKDGVEVFGHVNYPIFGLQFHPEVRRKDNAGMAIFADIVTYLLKKVRPYES